MKKTKVQILAGCAVLIAAQVILSRFCSINAWNLKIGFGFLPVMLAGLLYGPLQGAIVGFLSDFAGAVLFPIGPYFPGFSVCLAASGALFGALVKKNAPAWRIALAVGIDQLVLSLLVNTLWISILYGAPYLPLLGTRAGQCALMLPVEFLLTGAAVRLLPKIERLAQNQ